MICHTLSFLVSSIPFAAAALESARSSDIHNHGMGSSYCNRLQAQVSHLGDMLKVQRERQGLHSCFSLWRSSVVNPGAHLRIGEHQQSIATPTGPIEVSSGTINVDVPSSFFYH